GGSLTWAPWCASVLPAGSEGFAGKLAADAAGHTPVLELGADAAGFLQRGDGAGKKLIGRGGRRSALEVARLKSAQCASISLVEDAPPQPQRIQRRPCIQLDCECLGRRRDGWGAERDRRGLGGPHAARRHPKRMPLARGSACDRGNAC